MCLSAQANQPLLLIRTSSSSTGKEEQEMASNLQWLKEASFLHLQQTNLAYYTLPYATVLIILVVLISYCVKHSYGNKRRLNLPPSPPKLPIIGNLHQLGAMPHHSLCYLSKKFGPIIHLQLGEILTVVVSSARLAKEVLTTHDLALASRPQSFSANYLLYNCTDISYSPYGAYWRQLRKICIHELLSAKRVESFKFVREEEVARLIRRVTDQSYPGTTNLSKKLALYASDIICRTVFGRSFSEGGEYDKHGFNKLLLEFVVLLGGFSLGDYFPSKEWLHTITGKKSRLMKNAHGFNSLFDEVIKEHQNPNREEQKHKDLIDVLLDVQKDGSLEMPLTMDNIKAVLMDMFVAGTDTSFITMDWVMTELIMNQKAMDKAQKEIRSIMEERKTVLESDLLHMHYLKAVIKEILRLHPPAPLLLPRESMQDVTIDGYNIPAKTQFFVNAWAIGRDPESWENPDTFEPDRFMGSSSTIDFKGQNFELLPFGSGRRMCPGVTFGTAAIELALAQLLHSFDWELPPGIKAKDLDMTEKFGLVVERISNLIMVAKPHFS